MLAPAALVALITSYGYVLIFLLAIVEGPIVSIVAGFVSSLGYLDILVAYGVLVASDMVGDMLYYALGRWGASRRCGGGAIASASRPSASPASRPVSRATGARASPSARSRMRSAPSCS